MGAVNEAWVGMATWQIPMRIRGLWPFLGRTFGALAMVPPPPSKP